MRRDTLTGIRPFASFAVFFFHFGRPLVDGAPAWLRSLCGSGYVAVSFFYVLSGFVLTIGQRHQLEAGTFDARRFVTRRIARVAPAALLALALMLPLALYAPWGRATGAFPEGGARIALSGVLHLLFVQAWFPSLALTWNLPAWSVSVELAFYLVFPWLARTLLAGSRPRRWGALVAAWTISLTVAGVYCLAQPDGAGIGPDSSAPYLDALKFWPPLRLPEFVFGVALGTLYDRTRPVPRALGAGALALLILTLSQAHHLPYVLLHNGLLLPAFGAILVAVAGARGRVAAVLGSAPLVRLGRAGYSFYILQMPLMYLVLLAGGAGLHHWSGAGFFVRFGALVLFVALLADRLLVRAPVSNKSPARHLPLVTQRR